MKKISFILLALLSLLFPSCESRMQEELKQKEMFSDYLSIIRNLGYDETCAVDKGKDYVVEGDILLNKNELLNYALTSTRQARAPHIISTNNRRSIVIGIDTELTNMNNKWINRVNTAVTHWNNIAEGGIKINITGADRYNTTYNVHLRAANTNDGLANNVFGEARPPSTNGKPGNLIIISPPFCNNNGLTESQIIYNLVHEIGHVLGFRHTNWSKLNENTAIGVNGTPNSGNNPDPNSVMNGNTALNSWNGFSAYDKIAINTLYPSKIYNSFNSVDTVYLSHGFTPIGGTSSGYIFNVSAQLHYDVPTSTYGVSTINVGIKNENEYSNYTVLSHYINNISFDGNLLIYKINVEYSIPGLIPIGAPPGTLPLLELCSASRTFTHQIPQFN